MAQLITYMLSKTLVLLTSEYFMYATGLCIVVGVLELVYRLIGKSKGGRRF